MCCAFSSLFWISLKGSKALLRLRLANILKIERQRIGNKIECRPSSHSDRINFLVRRYYNQDIIKPNIFSNLSLSVTQINLFARSASSWNSDLHLSVIFRQKTGEWVGEWVGEWDILKHFMILCVWMAWISNNLCEIIRWTVVFNDNYTDPQVDETLPRFKQKPCQPNAICSEGLRAKERNRAPIFKQAHVSDDYIYIVW